VVAKGKTKKSSEIKRRGKNIQQSLGLMVRESKSKLEASAMFHCRIPVESSFIRQQSKLLFL